MIDQKRAQGFHTYTFYSCIKIKNPSSLKQRIRKQANNLKIIGTIILTQEGINSTISSSSKNNLNKMISLLENKFGPIRFRDSFSQKQPFKRLKVKVRKEVVPSGTNIMINKDSSKYIEPENWNDFIKDDSVLVIDVRNDYEVEVGSFLNSISPETKTFKEFGDFVESSKENFKNKKLVFFVPGELDVKKHLHFLKIKELRMYISLKAVY